MTADGVRTVRAGRRTVEVHRPDKVLFPGGGGAKEYTKADLVAYHQEIAPYMLPHLRGRPPGGRAPGPARRRLDALRG